MYSCIVFLFICLYLLLICLLGCQYFFRIKIDLFVASSFYSSLVAF